MAGIDNNGTAEGGTDTYILSLPETQKQLDWCAEQLVQHLTDAYATSAGDIDDVESNAVDAFTTWAGTCAAGPPELRWACLQACATFARGMITDAGHSPLELAQHMAPGGRLPANDESPDVNAGITDALGILGLPGNPETELGDEWLGYAADTCPPDRYIAAVTFLFFLSVASFPEAAQRQQA